MASADLVSVMKDILKDLDAWMAQGRSIALATVIRTWGSSPRQPGAKMGVNALGEMTGSVSGGCVEGAVVEEALGVLHNGQASRLHFGVADETAWEVGLACGGEIDVLVNPLSQEMFRAARAALDNRVAYSLVTVDQGPQEWLGKQLFVTPSGSQGSIDPAFDDGIIGTARQAISTGKTESLPLRDHPAGLHLFYDTVLPPSTLIMVGGVHISIALASLAKTLGYYTIIIDPRRAFGSQTRFAHVDELHQLWPDEAFRSITLNEATAVTMLTHDPKIDDPALEIVLDSPVFYIGALGSQKTQARRRERLLAAGLRPEKLDRIHGPIGLDLGGRSPEEIGLAIMAEIVAVRNRGPQHARAASLPANR